MTDANWERLKLIEQTPYLITDNVLLNDFKWLIEQAKRGQLMEQYRFESEMHLDLYEKVLAANSNLGEALEFYADRENYINGNHDLMGELPSRVQMDEGELAREVLGLE